jgi:hypothetical protein
LCFWRDSVLDIPSTDRNTFTNRTTMTGYAALNPNWK